MQAAIAGICGVSDHSQRFLGAPSFSKVDIAVHGRYIWCLFCNFCCIIAQLGMPSFQKSPLLQMTNFFDFLLRYHHATLQWLNRFCNSF